MYLIGFNLNFKKGGERQKTRKRGSKRGELGKGRKREKGGSRKKDRTERERVS